MKTHALTNGIHALLVVFLMAFLALSGCDLLGLTEEQTGNGPNPSGTQVGTVQGTIIDVTSGDGLSGVSITVLNESGYDATSESDGSFTIVIPIGSQILVFTKPGFSFSNYPVTVNEGSTTTIPQSEVIGNPALGTGELRFVLTWGENPSDLDSHLLTPNGQHVYYSNQAPIGAGANLDVDDVTSYGPETVTITSQQSGTYIYYVHRYAGIGTLAGSNALVRVFNSGGEVTSFTAPTTGTGDYWKVFTLNGTNITPVNQIQTTEPTL